MIKDTYPKCYAKFKKQSLERFDSLINKSTSTQSEHGASLCMDRENKISIRNTCIGNKCSVYIGREKPCELGEIELGDFHTHTKEILPFSIDLPSPDDWYDWLHNFLSCLGTKNGTKCYQQRRDYTSEDMSKMKGLATIMSITESQVDTEHPNSQQRELIRFKKYNDELQEYYHKFDAEECRE